MSKRYLLALVLVLVVGGGLFFDEYSARTIKKENNAILSQIESLEIEIDALNEQISKDNIQKKKSTALFSEAEYIHSVDEIAKVDDNQAIVFDMTFPYMELKDEKRELILFCNYFSPYTVNSILSNLDVKAVIVQPVMFQNSTSKQLKDMKVKLMGSASKKCTRNSKMSVPCVRTVFINDTSDEKDTFENVVSKKEECLIIYDVVMSQTAVKKNHSYISNYVASKDGKYATIEEITSSIQSDKMSHEEKTNEKNIEVEKIKAQIVEKEEKIKQLRTQIQEPTGQLLEKLL